MPRRPVVHGGGDPPQGRAFATQPRISANAACSGRVRFQMLPVLCEPVPERDVAYALALAALVLECIAGALSDGNQCPFL